MYINRRLIKDKIKEKNIFLSELAEKCYPNHSRSFQALSDLINHRRDSINLYALHVIVNELSIDLNELFIYDKT